jgi:quercetin 2,3-dioxygenase
MRELNQIVSAVASQDGDGVKIHRVGGQQVHQLLNPFLMLDEINSDDASDYIPKPLDNAGFRASQVS